MIQRLAFFPRPSPYFGGTSRPSFGPGRRSAVCCSATGLGSSHMIPAWLSGDTVTVARSFYECRSCIIRSFRPFSSVTPYSTSTNHIPQKGLNCVQISVSLLYPEGCEIWVPWSGSPRYRLFLSQIVVDNRGRNIGPRAQATNATKRRGRKEGGTVHRRRSTSMED